MTKRRNITRDFWMNCLRQGRRVVLVSSSILMAALVAVLVYRFALEPVEAGVGLAPAWTPDPSVGDNSWFIEPWAKPVQNTSTSRLFAYVDTDAGEDWLRTYRVRDDGTLTLGTRLGPSLSLGSNHGNVIGFVSDRSNGAYVGWTQLDIGDGYDNHFARVGTDGSRIWELAPNDAIGLSVTNGFQFMDTADTGNLLFAYLAGTPGNYRICGEMLNRTTGAKMWSTSAECTLGTRGARLLWSGNIYPYAMTSDGVGGMFILGKGDTMKLRRISSSGGILWTVDIAASRQPRAMVYQNGSVVMLSNDGSTLYLDKRLSDGSNPWSSSLQVNADPGGGSSGKMVLTGDDQVGITWTRSSDSALMLNLYNTSSKKKVWPTDKLVDTDASSGYSILSGPQSSIVLNYCYNSQPSSSDCSTQIFSQAGVALLGSEGATIHDSRLTNEVAVGIHANATDSRICLDQGFGVFGTAVGAQMYCLNETPTLTTPLCSINNGTSFTNCSDAQIGKTVSYVQANCTPGTNIPLGEGAFANDPTLYENGALYDGQYVVYGAGTGFANPGSPSYEVYAQDLGPDQTYKTPDDGVRMRLTNDSSWDYPLDVQNGRIVVQQGATGQTIRIFDIASGTFDPGSISGGGAGTFTGRLDGRYLATNGNNSQMKLYDLGPDERLGTADDGDETWLDVGSPLEYEIAGRYIVVFTSAGPVKLVDLTDLTVTLYPVSNVTEISFDGRYLAFSATTSPPTYDWIYVTDFGTDGVYGTADDVSSQAITGTPNNIRNRWPIVRNGVVTWTRWTEGGGCNTFDWATCDRNVLSYDIGADGLVGTGDDAGPTQVTSDAHAQYAAESEDGTIVWVDNRNGAGDYYKQDLYIYPYGTTGGGIDSVRFTMTSPSGAKYTDQTAEIVNGDTYALHYPILINEAGEWRVQATCVDALGLSSPSETVWDAGIWPFSTNQKLSVYEGVAQIAKPSGDVMQIGNDGGDIASTGNIFLRPNGSYAGLAWEGVTSSSSERLHIPLGMNGQPAVLAQGYGTDDTPNGANGIGGYFDGAASDAAGAGVAGDVTSCGSAGGCAGGRFDGGSFVGLHAESYESSFPSLFAANGAGPSGLAASLDGIVSVTGNIEAVSAVFPACAWVTIVSGDTVCPNEGFIAGFDETSAGAADKIYCCGN